MLNNSQVGVDKFWRQTSEDFNTAPTGATTISGHAEQVVVSAQSSPSIKGGQPVEQAGVGIVSA